MPQLEKGQTVPLNVTLKARRRILCGLGWDPAEEPGLIDKVKALAARQDLHHDLDLACYTYGPGLEFLEKISADPEYATGASDRIYHSGDNEEGHGEGDDEEISAELKDMPESVRHIVFLALVRTTHTFADIDSAEMRLADGYTNHNFLSVSLTHEEGRNKNAFIFTAVSRDEKSESGWSLKHIGEYLDYSGAVDFPERVKGVLRG